MAVRSVQAVWWSVGLGMSVRSMGAVPSRVRVRCGCVVYAGCVMYCAVRCAIQSGVAVRSVWAVLSTVRVSVAMICSDCAMYSQD